MGADGKDRIIVIVGTFTGTHCQTGQTVMVIDVFDIFADITAFDVETVQIRGGHDDDIGIHFHHQGDDHAGTDVIRFEPGILFGQFEDLIPRIVGHVMDDTIGVVEQPLHKGLIIFVKAAGF